MAYEVLARKYRSRTFDELVGQPAISTTLKHAIETGRIHHGYLFTGTRGVGKTSMARILAKSLNCFAADAPTATPCCECESCLRIAEGSDLDVIEIDAASNTGVDNIRDLRSNAAYKPARSRFKVYIIDEVHMLSTGAFNALLKTLEEPPEHVKFVLATTEAHKVPATIKSRCQKFDFRSISPADLLGQLRLILETEKITAEEAVLRRVSRLANGSMRDALSLLDQLLAYGTADLTEELIDNLLPTAHDEHVHEVLDAVFDGDATVALRCVDTMLACGNSPARLCDSLIDHLRTLMLLRVCGSETDLLDLSSAVRQQMDVQAKRNDAATYVYLIGLMEEVRRQVKSCSSPRPLMDAAIVRMTMTGAFTSVPDLVRKLAREQGMGKTQEHKKKTPPSLITAPEPRRKGESDAATVSSTPSGLLPPRPVAAARSASQRRTDTGRGEGVKLTEQDRATLLESQLIKQAVTQAKGAIIDVRQRTDGD